MRGFYELFTKLRGFMGYTNRPGSLNLSKMKER